MTERKLQARFLIALMIICTFALSLIGVTAFAETDSGVEVKLAHITDLHYYPLYMSYPETAKDYSTSAFKHKSNREMKLLTESSVNLRQTLDYLLTQDIDYLLVSGDLTSDGERQGLIDVANSLRDFQNRKREQSGNTDFQVLVQAGNHDIANDNARDYRTHDGVAVDSVSREEFSQIFAGLGYPSMTEDQAREFYTDDEYRGMYGGESRLADMPYTGTDIAYVQSDNAPNAQIAYIGGEVNALGGLTYIARMDGITIMSIDTLYSTDSTAEGGETVGSVVGGSLHASVQEWLTDNISESDESIISFSHHNILEHMSFEELYMPDYVVDNWRDAREFLAQLGVNYHFSGHIHASDIASFVDYDGNTLYDTTTPSLVGYGAGYRLATLTYYQGGYSDIDTAVHELDKVDYSELFDRGFLDKSRYSSADYADILGYDLVVSTVGEYAEVKLLDSLLDNLLVQYVGSNGRDIVKGMIADILADIDLSGLGLSDAITETLENALSAVQRNIDQLTDNVIRQINTKTLRDYEYEGDVEAFKGVDNKLYAVIYDMVRESADTEVVKYKKQHYSLEDILLECYKMYIKGDHYDLGESWVLAGLDSIFDGSVTNEIRSNIIDNYLPHIRYTMELDMDLTGGIARSDIEAIDKALALSFTNVRLNKFNINTLLSSKSIQIFLKVDVGSGDELIDMLIEDYFTEDFARTLGGGVGDLLLSLATDSSKDGSYGESIRPVYKEGDKHSSMPNRSDIEPSIEDGRKPSMLTVSMGSGDGVLTDRYFVWYSDVRAQAPTVQYMEGVTAHDFDLSKVTSVTADSEILAYTDSILPGFGGVDRQISRHRAGVTGLKPNTTYIYRVGDAGKGWWSDVYTLTTGADRVNEPFEVLLVSDIYGYSSRDFAETNQMLTDAGKVFKNDDYDFIINLGGSVEHGDSMRQWSNLLDGSSVFATHPTVFVGGGSDDVNHFGQPVDGVTTQYNTLDQHTYQPARKGYYSFDYSGVHFVVLDTGEELTKISQQYRWLEADLEGTTLLHKVVLMHKGPYTSGKFGTTAEAAELREILTPLFSKTGVSVVFQGYDRVYSESAFIGANGETLGGGYYPGNSIANNNGGVLYVGLGTASTRFTDMIENSNVPVHRGEVYQNPRLTKPTFGKLVFDGQSISYTGYQYNLENGRITKIISLIPWWVKLIIGLSVSLVSLIVAVVAFIIIRKNIRKNKYAQVAVGGGSGNQVTNDDIIAVKDSTVAKKKRKTNKPRRNKK